MSLDEGRTSIVAAILSFVATATIALAAQASPIQYIDASRSVSHARRGCYEVIDPDLGFVLECDPIPVMTVEVPSAPFAPFSYSSEAARQTSTLEAASISAYVSVDEYRFDYPASPAYTDYFGDGEFEVRFSVTERSAYALSASRRYWSSDFSSANAMELRLEAHDATTGSHLANVFAIDVVDADSDISDDPFNGILEPGVIYTVSVAAIPWQDHGFWQVDFTLDLTPVPEPSAAIMQLVALAVLGAFRLDRRRAPARVVEAIR